MRHFRYLLILLAIPAFLLSCGKEGDPEEELDIIEIKTSFGDIYIWLYDETPLHKDNFLDLAGSDFYDGTTFHRIIDGFVIQGGDPNSKDGDPTNDGQGGPGYTIPAEFVNALKHDQGAVAAARKGDAVNPEKESSGSQFYIVEPSGGTHNLDGDYTVFGMVMTGIDVVETIAVQPKDGGDRPLTNITMDVNVLKKTRAQIESEYGYTPE